METENMNCVAILHILCWAPNECLARDITITFWFACGFVAIDEFLSFSPTRLDFGRFSHFSGRLFHSLAPEVCVCVALGDSFFFSARSRHFCYCNRCAVNETYKLLHDY